jgi:hypothetical protein
VTAELIESLLKYGVVPLWLAAGFADWLCHRTSSIETTSGPKESLLHIAQFAEVGIGLLAVLFFEISAALFGLLILCVAAHELTAIWDVRYANHARRIGPAEQHVHGILESLPFVAVALLALRHWPAFADLARPSSWLGLTLKPTPFASPYVWWVLAASALFGALPYAEELIRTLRAWPNGAAAARR